MRVSISFLAALAAAAMCHAQQQRKAEDIYGQYCAACHGAKFEGGMGGSLVDGQWKHGSTDAAIYQSIAKGNLELGMTPWEGVLTGKEIRSLVILLQEKEKQTLTKGIEFPKPSLDKVTETKLHKYRIENVVANGLVRPWAIAFLHDGSKLVAERPGGLRIIRPDPKFRTSAGVHFGTRIVFHEGYLFFPIGERGGMMAAQDLASPVGKIFRLHDDGRVPKDNPFVGRKDAIPAIWSYGHRNPQGLTMDPRDGSLYATEHGPRGGDELNLIRPGLNYGWPVVTFGMNYNGTPMVSITEKEGIEPPLVHWTPSLAVCGLDFYTGGLFPEWQHDLISGGLAQQEVRRIRIRDGKVADQEIILKDIGRVRDVTGAPDGAIYVVLNGPDSIVRMVPAK